MKRKPIWIISGAIGIAIAVSIGTWYGTAEGPQLIAIFKEYEQTEDGLNSVAVLCLTNSCDRQFGYFSANQMSSNGVRIVHCQFREQTGAGLTNWFEQKTPNRVITMYNLMPGSSALVAAPVPKDDRVANVGVYCRDLGKKRPWIFERLQPFVLRLLPPRRTGVWVWCETAVSSTAPSRVQESSAAESANPKATANK